ncbi:hypothetical protein ANCCAN_12396 [Ancylostoma caninum]|uniref:Uncharacterized protein n=1 Tax=Ancylostoma caninum TaxID=29170 RepID=A0A368GFP4_ANCCA|nr:hypothetical protein ANCCAN_12396 [Ancylostoma caninum]
MSSLLFRMELTLREVRYASLWMDSETVSLPYTDPVSKTQLLASRLPSQCAQKDQLPRNCLLVLRGQLRAR